MNLLTLNFKQKIDQENYDEETKFRNILFIRFFLFYILFVSFLSCAVDFYTMNYSQKFTSILLICFISISFNLFLKKISSEKKIFFNMLLGLLICIENIINSEIFVGPILNFIKKFI